MPYNDLTDRAAGAALIPEDVADEIWKNVPETSAAMALFKHRRMTRAQQRVPVLSLFPTAYFVSGDTGLKQTTDVAWSNKYLNAEEIAVIFPVPENLVDDAEFPIWDEARPLIEEAVGICLDNAVFFGVNKPTTWPTAIAIAAYTVGNTVVRGTSAIDLADDINNVMAAVEADGYDVNGFWGKHTLRGALRGLRGTDKSFIFSASGPANNGVSNAGRGLTRREGELFNERIIFNRAGLAWTATGPGAVELIAGDWSQAVLGIRKDMTIKKLTEAVIQDGSGNIIYNLAQQDMIAYRMVIRVAFQVANPINRINVNTPASDTSYASGDRYPFAILEGA
jgi:HK97 family phage major capsid protein